MTLGRGETPAALVRGRGMDTRVLVDGRTIALQGDRVVIAREEPDLADWQAAAEARQRIVDEAVLDAMMRRLIVPEDKQASPPDGPPALELPEL
jgi:hypothetical protein